MKEHYTRSPSQYAADQREKAIRACCATIRSRNPSLTNAQILERATQWYDKIEEKQKFKDEFVGPVRSLERMLEGKI